MQKKLIALAIAGLSSAAFAQSNVTIYGVMDLTQESAKATGSTVAANDQLSRGRLASNSSYIGFKGSESLGNGMTAVFQYETAFDGSAAGALAGGRDTYIGVAGGFGTIAGGTLTHPYRTLGAVVDNNPGASSVGFTGSIYGEFGGIKTGTDERATNAIAYISPNFNGFQGIFAYVNGETARTNATSSVNGKAWQLAATYTNGPVFVGYAHHDAADAATAAAIDADNKFKGDRIAGTYTFAGATKISALWDRQKLNFLTGAGSDAKRTAWMLGVSHTFGANQIYAQYAKSNNISGSAVTGVDDTQAKQWTLGYVYSMSKRTSLHAYATKIINGTNGQADFYVNGVGGAAGNLLAGGAASIGAGADPTAYGVGMRHTF